MKKIFSKISLFNFVAILLFSSCSTTKNVVDRNKENSISSIKFLSEYIMPLNGTFQNTLVGGLSGIDYDRKKNQYYMISDDPSQFSPARIYTAEIDIKEDKIDTVRLTGVTFILQNDGTEYPKYQYGKNSKADGESVRYNPLKQTFVWSNEGERLYRKTDTTIVQPALTFLSTTGKYLDTIPLPAGFHITKQKFGVRKNAFFEGLSYADNFKTLYASLEEPLYQDGEQSHFEFNQALTRIVKFDVDKKQNTAQYAYRLDALPIKPTAESDWNLNGISEILTINNHTLLVMERAWAKGRDDHSFVKLYLVDLDGAENVINNPSFIANPPKPLKKTILFDFDSLNMHIDNIEGITFGPKLPNGNNTLVFCVDNNFGKAQVQQFFLFEVIR
ncbi:esterase-like activity of phytase family protein [Pedobacter sp. MC2016-05]|uniref:esterase-like activity of phytase family protein n=1 Tax=Pedobacter sp. MC2016-05 TaxID=2994474 RepID=UPI0022460379|nr:esterase-like activity of phytase family protein [Pedobacter sp. MC2016-05]MCX2475110.1 esterase-like activity of phytase family protein [Pedobacter sp. MC2016-05]